MTTEQDNKPKRGSGRPPKPPKMQLVNKGITLLPEEWAVLDRVAADRKMTRAALLREILSPFFEAHR